MPPRKPIKRKELIRNLQHFGWDGPFSGGNHQYMRKGARKLIIPNPHGTQYSAQFVADILKQAGISKAEWEAL